MATAKTTTLTFRIELGLKDALRIPAAREHRSIADMVEVLSRHYCGRHGITIQQQQRLFGEPPPSNGESSCIAGTGNN